MHASADQVWRVISSPGNLTRFHPFCQENPVERWPGADSQDQVIYYNGLALTRNFTNWLEGIGYDLEAVDDAGERFAVSWRIGADGLHNSHLTITIRPYLTQYAERKRRQYARLFGSHRLFSPPVPDPD